jgi:hypothetical protein
VSFLLHSHVSLQKENEADGNCLILLLSEAYVIHGRKQRNRQKRGTRKQIRSKETKKRNKERKQVK